MTPFQLFRETPVRLRSLPRLWPVLICAAAAMFVAVVLTAWQATQFTHHHCGHSHRQQAATIIVAPDGVEVVRFSGAPAR